MTGIAFYIAEDVDTDFCTPSYDSIYANITIDAIL